MLATVLETARPTAFLATTDGDRARAFFAQTLGLRFVEDQGFALVFDLDGTTLRVARVDSFTPQGFTVLGWRVDDIELAVRGLAGRGVTFERYGFPDQDASGIWRSPSGARVAWFKDPDGNVLSVTQEPDA